jgi:septal ring factor EnvC (AmiA/AmiB activator)
MCVGDAPAAPSRISRRCLLCLLCQVAADRRAATEREQQLQEREQQLQEQGSQLAQAHASIAELQAERDEARSQVTAKQVELDKVLTNKAHLLESEAALVVSTRGGG